MIKLKLLDKSGIFINKEEKILIKSYIEQFDKEFGLYVTSLKINLDTVPMSNFAYIDENHNPLFDDNKDYNAELGEETLKQSKNFKNSYFYLKDESI